MIGKGHALSIERDHGILEAPSIPVFIRLEELPQLNSLSLLPPLPLFNCQNLL